MLTSLIAIIPFLVIILFIVFFKWPAIRVMPLAWLSTVTITLYFWRLSTQTVLASSFKGFLLALEIMLIIFSAVWILSLLQKKGMIKPIQSFLVSISPDARIQAIIIAWLFGSLIEGLAGFGTPALIAAPLLVSIGFSPIIAVVISLVANSASVSFGAVGTPIILGLGSLGLENLNEIAIKTSFIHLIASFIVPLAIVYFVIMPAQKERKTKLFIESIPFALFSWLAFTIPYFLTAYFIGPELPSIIGGVTGLIIVSIAAKYKILVPKNVFVLPENRNVANKKVRGSLILKSLIPYSLLIIFLLMSRVIPQIRLFLNSIPLSLTGILNTSISYQFLPLYTPSFYFFLTGLITILLFKINKKEIKETLIDSFSRIKKPAIALIFALGLVQLLLASENNILGIPSIPLVLAESVSSIFNKSFILISPLIGMFGAFIAGSNTVSNILFGQLQLETAKSLLISIPIILSLQVVGGAIGNMIAIHNILAASASVNLHHQEGTIIRKTLLVAIIYALMASILGYLLMMFS